MATLPVIRIGTRKSALALAQAELVRAALVGVKPELANRTEIVSMTTSGDKFTDRPLSDIGGKGLFTKEIEEALLEGNVDIAVHSMKDMPTVLPEGLMIAALLPREDPRDMLVGAMSLSEIPQGAKFGTSSLRRSAQVLLRRPDLEIVPLRGNVQTRLDKIQKGEASATMLAMAGLNRLGLTVPGAPLPVTECIPAVAQGAIGIECRSNDTGMRELLALINHQDTEIAVRCERAFLKVLDGSCRTPIAGYAEIKGDMLNLKGLIARPDGTAHHTLQSESDKKHAEALGTWLGQSLMSKAGKDFLN